MSCPDCLKGAIHSHSEAKGEENVIIYDKKCYVAPRPSNSTSESVIVYLTDSFGLNLINAKLLADYLAEETGCKVLIPDVIPLGGGPPSIMNYTGKLKGPENPWDIIGQIKRVIAMLSPGFFSFVVFSLRIALWSTPQRGYAHNILPFVRSVRAGLPAGAKLGVVGFCWGGWGSTILCMEPALDGQDKSLIDVQFCGHPYDLKAPAMIVEAVKKYKVPYSVAVGDQDIWLKKEAIDKTEAALNHLSHTTNGEDCNYEITVYPGCTHGFVVRAMPDNVVETEAAVAARAQAVRWLKRYLCEAEQGEPSH